MELRKNIKSCNINQGLIISHSQLTVIYKNDIYKSDTCVASFPGSPGTRKCIASIFCTFHVTKNTRLSTPAQLQFCVPECGSLGMRLIIYYAPWTLVQHTLSTFSRMTDSVPKPSLMVPTYTNNDTMWKRITDRY